jgi:hypothetical protein
MKNKKRWAQMAGLILIVCLGLQASCKKEEDLGQKGSNPGSTSTIFNRRFIPTIKPQMTYDQIVKLARGPGIKVEEKKHELAPEIQYRWKGGRDSVLIVKFVGDKMSEATVLAPNGHTYLIRNSGEVSDITE